MNIQQEVIELIASILEVNTSDLNEDTAIGDIPQWDSLKQLTIITSLEDKFDVQFEPEVVMDMEDISDMVAAIEDLKG